VTPGCRPRAPDALLLTPTRAGEYLAAMPGCRPRAPDAKVRGKVRGRCLKNRPWACRTSNGIQTSEKLMKKQSRGSQRVRSGPNLRVLVLKISYLEVKLPEVGLGSCRAALS